MSKPISIVRLAKWLRRVLVDVRDGQMFLVLDFKNGRLFVRKAEFHG